MKSVWYDPKNDEIWILHRLNGDIAFFDTIDNHLYWRIRLMFFNDKINEIRFTLNLPQSYPDSGLWIMVGKLFPDEISVLCHEETVRIAQQYIMNYGPKSQNKKIK